MTELNAFIITYVCFTLIFLYLGKLAKDKFKEEIPDTIKYWILIWPLLLIFIVFLFWVDIILKGFTGLKWLFCPEDE